MTNLSFAELDHNFRHDNFPVIENDERGVRYLKLRSMSRREVMEEFCATQNIDLTNLPSRQYFNHIFDLASVNNEQIDAFISKKYQQERTARIEKEEYIVDQLSRLRNFDWGGSFGNSLEKNIVDNYIKKIQSFEKINEEIEGSLLSSMRGYTLNSWYNHWTSILIEDLFKDHPAVLPTVGLVKKIDFFIKDIPFDLKVTYFPEQFLAEKLRQKRYGNELTKLKQICRVLHILIPEDLADRELKLHLYNKVSEDTRPEANAFIATLKQYKRAIITEAEANPNELKTWFYENQGEARFDASNRFFLVLTDESDIFNSWKLKRNIVFLKQKIWLHLDSIVFDLERLNTQFYWKKTQQTFNCKSDILFIKYATN